MVVDSNWNDRAKAIKESSINTLVGSIYSAKKNIEKQNKSSTENEFLSRKDDVVLFFSFDIVNSTMYKSVNYLSWSVVISKLLDKIKYEVRCSANTNRAEVWRVLGDEILFVKQIGKEEDIYLTIDGFYDILLKLCSELYDGSFFDDLEGFSHDYVLGNRLSLKAASWIAIVTDKESINVSTNPFVDNIHELLSEKGEYGAHEFIGIDIDTGFRISEFTLSRQLVLSFELSYLLSKNEKMKDNLNLITYRKLKGVWDNKAYPIIWYYDKCKNNGESFKDSLPYDAVSQNDLYKEYYETTEKAKKNKSYSLKGQTLRKILQDRRLESKINDIKHTMQESSQNYLDNPKLELHCAVVCFDKKGKALLVRRSTDKDAYPGMWEVGCAKANSRKTLLDSLVEEYKKDFQVLIKPLCDEERTAAEPHPLAVYSVNSGKDCHKGLIFVAEITEGIIKLNPKKHIEKKWITETDINSLREEECVPDLKDSLERAFAYYKENIKRRILG